MRELNPDSLQLFQSEERQERQARTGEVGNGTTVYCQPDLTRPDVVQQVKRATCLSTPYAACLYCPHHHFEYIFEVPEQDWVQCPRWNKGGEGPPDFYTPVWLSECRAKPYTFCPQCPGRAELVQLGTDKKKQGWLERYWKLTR